MAKKTANGLGSGTAKIWGVLRIALGSIFLWAFVDKLLGLGFATCKSAETGEVTVGCASSWLGGGSPTSGFLTHGTSGPLADVFQTMAGNPIVDGLFMVGLLGIGLALVLGIGMRIATYTGALLMLMMWAAALPVANHPFVDDHIIYAITLFALLSVNDSQALGLGQRWANTSLVKKFPILK